MLAASGAHSREYLALTMPRRTIWMRTGIRVINLMLAVTRKKFRVYDHSPTVIDETLHNAGLRKIMQRPAGLWEARVYEREPYARLADS